MNRGSRRKLALEKLDELEVIYGNIVNIPDNELIAVRLMLDAEWSPKSIEKTSANKLITMKKDLNMKAISFLMKVLLLNSERIFMIKAGLSS